jgi:hypothetical protein
MTDDSSAAAPTRCPRCGLRLGEYLTKDLQGRACHTSCIELQLEQEAHSLTQEVAGGGMSAHQGRDRSGDPRDGAEGGAHRLVGDQERPAARTSPAA